VDHQQYYFTSQPQQVTPSPKKMKGEKQRKSRKRKKKDPDAPKRAMSSFMFFANHRRAELRKANPEMKITEIGKELGKMWKELSDEERKPYQAQADEDKVRYIKAKESYSPPTEYSSDSSDGEGGRARKKRKKKKKVKDPKKPKRSMSSFMFFANVKRAEVRDLHPNLKITEIGKKLSELWKEISPEEKQKYMDMAETDKKRYKTAMESYKPEAVKQSSSSSSSGSGSKSD